MSYCLLWRGNITGGGILPKSVILPDIMLIINLKEMRSFGYHSIRSKGIVLFRPEGLLKRPPIME